MTASASTIAFTKYHGIGNDFIVVDAAGFPTDAAFVAAVCDRHRGVGADGVLLLETTPDDPDADATMVIYNADGSRPEMCGNGVRCVARHLLQPGSASAPSVEAVTIRSDAGLRACRRVGDDDPWQVEVEMGPARHDEVLALVYEGRSYQAHAVDMGNPHAVVFVDQPWALADIDRFGASLNRPGSPFERGVNLEISRIVAADRIETVVYERGVGRTQACGTGACAVAAAARRAGHTTAGSITVELPGGPLRIAERQGLVWMTGGVERVYEGRIDTGWLDARRDDG